MALSGSASVVSSSSSSAVAETAACIPFSHLNKHHFRPHHKVFFSVSPKPKLRLFAKTPSRAVAVKAQLNQVSLGDLKNDAPKTEKKSSESKTNESPAVSSSAALASEKSLSQFMNQVADLVKLVDSRDIVELQLKQLDCEIVIRKKEALPQTQAAAPVVMMHSPAPTMHSPPPAAAPSTPAPALAAQASAPPAAQQNKSSVPPLKSPIAGTFYRSPAPGAPPFVKVGDKVQKGQVVCIVEAMKLMNEIEADRSGTVVEIVAEDAKPVSVDTPLIMIQP